MPSGGGSGSGSILATEPALWTYMGWSWWDMVNSVGGFFLQKIVGSSMMAKIDTDLKREVSYRRRDLTFIAPAETGPLICGTYSSAS